MKITMPQAARNIIETLTENGYEAYIVGGCVRDSILGKKPKDWDITTSAKPEEVKSLFKKTIDTGIKHGTVTVMVKGEGYEVTTYRIDGEYEDGRHPKTVKFTSNLVEDLKRRDFTINAMAYNDEAGVVDCFDGIGDLNKKIIRCVGEAKERFTEDALRMLRAVRFAAVLDFSIDTETKAAIEELAESITKISRERIQVELDKLITSKHPEKILDIYDTGLMKWIFEEAAVEFQTANILAQKLKESYQNHFVRWAIFITYVDEKSLLKKLKFDNDTIKICETLFKHREDKLPEDEAGIRRFIVNIGRDIFEKYYLTYREALGNTETEKINHIRYV